jgi:hypothetical protein
VTIRRGTRKSCKQRRAALSMTATIGVKRARKGAMMNWRVNAFLAALPVGVLFAIILIAHLAIQHSAVG